MKSYSLTLGWILHNRISSFVSSRNHLKTSRTRPFKSRKRVLRGTTICFGYLIASSLSTKHRLTIGKWGDLSNMPAEFFSIAYLHISSLALYRSTSNRQIGSDTKIKSLSATMSRFNGVLQKFILSDYTLAKSFFSISKGRLAISPGFELFCRTRFKLSWLSD